MSTKYFKLGIEVSEKFSDTYFVENNNYGFLTVNNNSPAKIKKCNSVFEHFTRGYQVFLLVSLFLYKFLWKRTLLCWQGQHNVASGN